MTAIVVPFQELSVAALHGVIDAFVLREGTDYGHTDYDIDGKREAVLAQLRGGRAVVWYDPDSDSIDIRLTD